jgi:lipopolysaccharide export system permease protein
MHTLDRYITNQANRSIFVVVAALLSLITMFALFEEMDENQVTYGLAEASAYVLRTMPRRLDEILVYGLFLGYLIALGRLAETNELTICRVSGMSPLRLCLALAPSMLLWLVVSLVVSEYVAPISERVAEVNKLKAQYGDNALAQHGGLWLRDKQLFMRVDAIDEEGRIWGVNQYWLDEQDALAESISAGSGSYDASQKQWRLVDVVRTTLSADAATHVNLDSWIWKNPITPDVLASQAFLEPNKMSMSALYGQIQFARSQQMGVSEYELVFWARVLKPLTYIGLTLFALAVVLGPLRQVGMGVRLTFGIFAGLGFKYLQDLFAPAAIVFNIPAVIAILIPITLYWVIAWLLIRRNA